MHNNRPFWMRCDEQFDRSATMRITWMTTIGSFTKAPLRDGLLITCKIVKKRSRCHVESSMSGWLWSSPHIVSRFFRLASSAHFQAGDHHSPYRYAFLLFSLRSIVHQTEMPSSSLDSSIHTARCRCRCEDGDK